MDGDPRRLRVLPSCVEMSEATTNKQKRSKPPATEKETSANKRKSVKDVVALLACADEN